MSAVPASASPPDPAAVEAQRVDALAAAALLAVDPAGLGGAVLRAPAGPARDDWLAALRALLPADAPVRRVPLGIADDRLLGGLDLAATLAAGRPVAQRGVLADADGGIAVLAMAERLGADTAARVAAVLDHGEVTVQREGLSLARAARIGVVALDEGLTDDERTPAALRERLAFAPALPPRSPRDDALPLPWTRDDIGAARARLSRVRVGDDVVQALCAAALALGVDSVRAPLLAVRAARAAAALAGRTDADADDAALAARLVLAHRATRLPAPPPDDLPDEPAEADAEPPPPPQDAAEPPPATDDDAQREPQALEDRVLDAAEAAIPPGLLAALLSGVMSRDRSPTGGRAGALKQGRLRGRPAGVRRGEPRAGARLNLIATLRTAAPWQPLRRREAGARDSAAGARLHVRREDFHVTRFKQRSETTTLFVVDASGSSALHRLAEAKGAVELLLADCYVRRDRVAVIGFRGAGAELLLPPTRSLVRAKKSLAGLPGGGGTPLAAAIDSAAALADAVRRQGATPLVVLLTDGRANVARDGRPGRAQAQADAQAAAARLRATGVGVLLLDTSPQPQPTAQQLALAMGARYLPLPHADARAMSAAVQQAVRGADPVG
ncbi:magnesium chelatase subunit D [Azohydromonas sediminis]|uniref:magnesium chelatase subunit D n=1 Tax=Azohydromonas sediminis TaxID=2259674 RepID=UPI000E657240|nr:magnesium chelatase subunit D [Azohydromonas sediminis]